MSENNPRLTSVRRQYGNFTGFYSPNYFSPMDLYGTPDNPGLYFQMRFKASSIKKSMDDRRNFLASLSTFNIRLDIDLLNLISCLFSG